MIKSQEISNWLITSLKLTFVLVAAFLGHQYLILPLESLIADPEVVLIASLIFFPHGIKALIVTITGYYSILLILLAQFIGGLSYGLNGADSLIAASIGVIAVVLPLLLIRTLRSDWRPHGNLNLFWTMIAIGLGSSLLNSLIISLYHNYSLSGAISLRFLVGDILGVILVFLLVILFRKVLIKFALQRVKRKLQEK